MMIIAGVLKLVEMIASFQSSDFESSIICFLIEIQNNEMNVEICFILIDLNLIICSLEPLLIKDGLMIAYFSLMIFFICAFFNTYGDLHLWNPISWKEKIVVLSVSHPTLF